MKALHMLGEVILGSEDVYTVGAVVEVGLGMVIVLVIRSRSRKDFLFVCENVFFLPETYIRSHPTCPCYDCRFKLGPAFAGLGSPLH